MKKKRDILKELLNNKCVFFIVFLTMNTFMSRFGEG